jgi:hypothetical protein
MPKNEDKNEQTKTVYGTPEEQSLLNDIIIKQGSAESWRIETEETWEDEYKCFKGDQWNLSFARRNRDTNDSRPFSIDNFIFPAVMGMVNTITATTPEMVFEVSDGDNNTDDTELEKKINDNVANILEKNKFSATWKEIVRRGIMHGPIIGAVLWDNDWIGGVGPNRWIGEVRILGIKKDEIYFDPAILDLKERLQECSFINRKLRKKLQYFKDRWENGKYVQLESNDEDAEPADHNQAWLLENWQRGKPKFIPEKRKKELIQKMHEWLPPSINVDEFKAEKYRLMSDGKVDGVHVAYVATNVFLEYVPYAYEDGLYPFVYKVVYTDDKEPHGFGEIRNVMIPQVNHNKADEIELEAMSVSGLGGYFYSPGAVNSKQLEFIKRNNYRGGLFAEVDNPNGLKQREGAQVPNNIQEYKEHKQRMVETISKNTPIRQGMSPGSNMPFAAIAELGARTDTATKGIVETLEDFLKDIGQLVVNRIKENYTEERTYKVRENKSFIDPNIIRQLKMFAQMPETTEKYLQVNQMINQLNTERPARFGTFSNADMMRSWIREDAHKDEEGNVIPAKMETYMPDFTAKVKIMDERPTDRNYYIGLAKELYTAKKLDDETFWYVIEEGKFPPKEVILERLQKMAAAVPAGGMA